MRIKNRRSRKKRKSFEEIVKVFDKISSELTELQSEEEQHVERLELEVIALNLQMEEAMDQKNRAMVVAAKIHKLISVDESAYTEDGVDNSVND